jgi:hypothetical protein
MRKIFYKKNERREKEFKKLNNKLKVFLKIIELINNKILKLIFLILKT